MNISILGSCVTRDAMELDKSIKINKYFARTSLVSLASDSIEVEYDQLRNQSNFRKQCVYNDCNKKLYTDYDILEDEFLIIDLIDERFDLVRYKNSIITYSNELVESGIEIDKNFIIKRVNIDLELWKEAADIFISEISSKYHPKRVILHKAFMCNKYTDGNEIFNFENNEYIEYINNLLEEYYTYLEKNMPGINIINISENNIAYSKHKWGKSPMHYVDNYYIKLLNRIKQIIAEVKIFGNEQVFKGLKPIKYLFKENTIANNNKLLIVFSAFNSNKIASYNYLRTLEKYDCNKLFILDDYGDVGTYYTGCNGKSDIETSVISLITSIMAQKNISFNNVISLGSSKGGTAAFYYGMKYNFGTIISGAFQYKFASYLNSLSDKSIITALLEEVSDSNILKYDSLIKRVIRKETNTEIHMISGEGDWQYEPYMKPAIKYLKDNNIKYNLKLVEVNNHNDIAKVFPDFLDEILNEKLDSFYDINIDYNNKKIIIDMKDCKEYKTAYYLIKDGKKHNVINYDYYDCVYFKIDSPGVYEVNIFVMVDFNNRLSYTSNKYYID